MEWAHQLRRYLASIEKRGDVLPARLWMSVMTLGVVVACLLVPEAQSAAEPAGKTIKGDGMHIVQQFQVRPDAEFLAWSEDENKIVTAGRFDQILQVWDWRKGQVIAQLEKHGVGGSRGAIAFHGSEIITSPIRTDFSLALSRWNFEKYVTTEVLLPPPATRPSLQQFTVSADGNRLALARTSDRVIVFDTRSWQVVSDLTKRPEPRTFPAEPWMKEQGPIQDYRLAIDGLALSPDGSELATSNAEGPNKEQTISVYNVATGMRRLHVPVWRAGMVYGLCWSPDGRAIASLQLENVKTDNPPPGRIDAMESHLHIKIMDARSGNVIARTLLENGDHPTEYLAFSPDSSYLAVPDNGDETVKMFDARTLEIVQSIPIGGQADFVSFSPSGHWLAVARRDRVLVLNSQP